jgi:peroxiredoxin
LSGPLDFEPDGDDAPAPPAPPAAPRPPGGPVPKVRPPWASRWGWLVGALVLLAIALFTLNTFGDDEGGAKGLKPGAPIPPFAAPLATSDLDGDVNVATKPDSGAAGKRPACEVRGADVVNSCELLERGPLVLAFLATRGGDCTDTLDDLQRAHERYPKVQFAAVSIRGNRGDLRRMIAEHGWTFPVAYDHDGVLAGLYGVAVCPHVAFVYPDGTVRGTVLGREPAAELDGRVRRLAAASRERGWTG